PPLITEQGILLFYNGSNWQGDVSTALDRTWDVDLSTNGNYAYIPGKGANNATVWVVNVSDPAHPTTANTIDIPTSAGKAPEAWAVQVVGNLLYVAAFQAGFWIYDITDPMNPAVVGSLVDNSTESRDLHVVGDYAYLADTWHGLSIVDISNPANPTRISLYNTDQDIGQGNPNKKAEFHDVKVINDTAYCAGGNYGLVIVDVSNPNAPSGISFCCDSVTKPRYPTGTYDWGRGVEVSGNYAYLSDNHAGLRIVDISDPAAPTEVGSYYISNGGELWKIKVIGDTLYVPYDKSGLIILDVNNPENPIELSTYAGNYQEVSIRGNIAYVVEESSFRTFDISNPVSITQIGRLSSGRFVEYATGWALFSIDNPTQVLVRSNEPILLPTEEWEIEGQVNHVVFSEGLVNYHDIWYLYYGGADSRIGVARREGFIITAYDDPLTRLGVILQPQGNGFERDRVFNPSVIVEADTMYMIYRAKGTPGGSYLALANSANGINFTRYAGNPLMSGEDPRVVKFDNTYYLYYKTDPLGINLATSTNLINWTQHGTILVPVNDWESHQIKAPAPVPEKINGKYWMYYQGEQIPWHTKMGLAYSDNLRDWIRLPDPVMTPREGYFDSQGTEPGVAVIIDEGIFMIYNGWGGDGTNRNQVGWAIFDKQDPSNLIARCDTPIVYLSYDHVFCEGLVEYKDQWYLYWGAADQWIEGAIINI
ncbi:MAG: family 43 glycosylhydrolase, partial [Candidatus Marinimicrobia bacterium]|nr:family 43 glycosylhydrolase [Candidatus Neomarinimicrobiota bacterium]